MVRSLAYSCALLGVVACAQADFIRSADARTDGNATFVYEFANDEYCAGPMGTAGNHWGTRNLNAYLGGTEGEPVIIHGITWNFMVESYDPSPIWHLGIAISDEAGNSLLWLNPSGEGYGPKVFSGWSDFSDMGFSDLVLPSGVLRIEFFDAIDDLPGPDGRFVAGTGLFLSFDVTIVPAPSSIALLGASGLVAARRRR